MRLEAGSKAYIGGDGKNRMGSLPKKKDPSDYLDHSETGTAKAANQSLDPIDKKDWEILREISQELKKQRSRFKLTWTGINREVRRDAIEQMEDEGVDLTETETDADVLLLLYAEKLRIPWPKATYLSDRGFRHYARMYVPDSSILTDSEDALACRLRRLRRKRLVNGTEKVGWTLSEKGIATLTSTFLPL
jgi:hypothetical protein